MASNHSLSTKPFRLGLPTIPGHHNRSAVDPYAERAIKRIGDALGEIRWLEPQQAIQVLQLSDEREWRDQFVLLWLSQPFDAARGNRAGIPLEDLLARQGHTALIQKVRQIVESDHRPINTTALLANDDIFHYSFARAYYLLEFRDADGIACWLVDDEDGAVAEIYQLVAIEAMNDYVHLNKVEVDVGGNRQSFDDAVASEVAERQVAYEVRAFEHYLRGFVEDFAYRRAPLDIIRRTSQRLGLNATPEEVRYLAEYFERSPINLTQTNASDVIPVVLTQFRATTTGSLISPSTVAGPLDFGVTYHTSTDDAAAVNTDNVRCAAQLFYVMTLGDELGVFRASDLLVTRKLSAGHVDVQSPQLLRDLQDYAFNDEFRDVSSSRIHQRTAPEERQMFYRQVFDLGDTQLLEGMVTNTDFTNLWSALMVETVRYIEKVERSEQPEANVSRNGVAQVIDDLRYNLSTYCSGMAKVMTPIIYRELDFLIERIWKSQEIIDQLALHNTGSFWRAIERCLQEDTGHSIGLTALLKKAEYGHLILSSVADFSPQAVLDDQRWTQLVSTIEAFIITSEQVDVDHGHEDALDSAPGMNGLNGQGVGPVDEWAF